jgi:hypothetical protein
MTKVALSILLVLSTFSVAAPHPDEYSINVHVISSHWVMEPAIGTGPEAFQKLKVVIDGKKYELEAPTLRANLQAGVASLGLGDYKAKLVQDKHKTAYESSQAYEFLFPDNTTRKFTVVGRTE